MRTFFLIIFVLFSSLHAEDISANKYAKLLQKGEKIAHKLCDEKKLLQITALDKDSISKEIETLKPCTALNRRNQKALIYFLLSKKNDTNSTNKTINVPKDSKCPVCGMFVTKYPKWVATIKLKEKLHYFDGVKDMMKFYIFDVDFPYNRKEIESISVTDFYTLKEINAKEAFYVIGSNIFGPMGDELIPFIDQKSADNFMHEHKGKKVLNFTDISSTLVMGLDGI